MKWYWCWVDQCPDMWEALGTWAASVFAGGALMIGATAYMREHQRRVRQQASRVSFSLQERENMLSPNQWQIMLHNRGDLPVHTIRIGLQSPAISWFVTARSALNPGVSCALEDLGWWDIETTDPRLQQAITGFFSPSRYFDTQAFHDAAQESLTMLFTDADGVRWRRSIDGSLRRLRHRGGKT